MVLIDRRRPFLLLSRISSLPPASLLLLGCPPSVARHISSSRLLFDACEASSGAAAAHPGFPRSLRPLSLSEQPPAGLLVLPTSLQCRRTTTCLPRPVLDPRGPGDHPVECFGHRFGFLCSPLIPHDCIGSSLAVCWSSTFPLSGVHTKCSILCFNGFSSLILSSKV